MRKTITSVIAITITAVSVAVLVKKIISDKKFHDVEIINIDETCSTPSSESELDSSIRIEEDTNSLTLMDDDIISSIKVLMNDEDCSSFKYAILEAALSQAENGEIKNAVETIALIGEEI